MLTLKLVILRETTDWNVSVSDLFLPTSFRFWTFQDDGTRVFASEQGTTPALDRPSPAPLTSPTTSPWDWESHPMRLPTLTPYLLTSHTLSPTPAQTRARGRHQLWISNGHSCTSLCPRSTFSRCNRWSHHPCSPRQSGLCGTQLRRTILPDLPKLIRQNLGTTYTSDRTPNFFPPSEDLCGTRQNSGEPCSLLDSALNDGGTSLRVQSHIVNALGIDVAFCSTSVHARANFIAEFRLGRHLAQLWRIEPAYSLDAVHQQLGSRTFACGHSNDLGLLCRARCCQEP